MKEKITFSCSFCDKKYFKWQGNCFECHKFDTISEVSFVSKKKSDLKTDIVLIDEITIQEKSERIKTYISELDRVLGGGIVPHSVILLSGNPGIGKSTLLLHIICALSDSKKILYISSEEDEVQIKLRLSRLYNQKTNWFIKQESDFETILATIKDHSPEIVIIDSLQNININTELLANHIQKIKIVTQKLVEDAKTKKYILIFTGHVTKDGEIAGPKTLEHLVDTVLYFDADMHSNLRILRSTKNRFGPIDEVGFFTMTETGIIECTNPQEIFIENTEPTIGSALTWIKEGSREFLVEIQTLLVASRNHTPQRIIQGIEHKQFLLLCAIIEKYLKIPLFEFDIFSKVRGNFKCKEIHADISIVISILSSYFHKTSQKKILYCGEINLSGNITTKTNLPQKIPLKKYGIEYIVTGTIKELTNKEITIKTIESVYNIIKIFQ